MVAGRHNVIALNTPQGSLFLKMGGVTRYPRLQAIVRQSNTLQTVNAQEFNTVEKYITGTYDLEVLTVPRLYFKGITMKQNQTTTIEIPNPGLVQLSLSKDISGAIFQKVEGRMEWVMDIPGNVPKQLFNMQPGDYTIIYRMAGETRTLYSKNKTFKVNSGTTTQVSL